MSRQNAKKIVVVVAYEDNGKTYLDQAEKMEIMVLFRVKDDKATYASGRGYLRVDRLLHQQAFTFQFMGSCTERYTKKSACSKSTMV